jgi:hypothetical protein
MSEMWADPLPGAPCTSRSLAQLALGVAAREVADFARSMVPTGKHRTSCDGAVLADALRLRELVRRVVHAAVVAEREDGTPWEDIADALGTAAGHAQQQWQPTVNHWREHLRRPPGTCGGDEAALIASPGQVAEDLDHWVTRHREPQDPDGGPQPVSDALERMHPALELLHRHEQQHVLEQALQGTPADPAILAALVELADRAALLHEALATDPNNPAPERRRDAASARSRAADLRRHRRG